MITKEPRIPLQYDEDFISKLQKLYTDDIKVQSAIRSLRYQISDINSIIESMRDYSMPDFYTISAKGMLLYQIVNFIMRKINYILNDHLNDSEFEIIDRFETLRSLTTAHPLSTNRHPKSGYGKSDEEKWNIDIHCGVTHMDRALYDSKRGYANKFKDINGEPCEPDFTLVMASENRDSLYLEPLYVQSDYINVLQIILERLKDAVNLNSHSNTIA